MHYIRKVGGQIRQARLLRIQLTRNNYELRGVIPCFHMRGRSEMACPLLFGLLDITIIDKMS